MRTPTWESSTGALAAMFAEAGPMILADAWTIKLASGTLLQWSGIDAPFSLGARAFTLGPGITRNRLKWRVGISTDTLSMTLTDIVGTTINGQGLAAFIRARGFAGAQVTLERAFWRPTDAGPVGALGWFWGDIEDADGDRYQANITVASWTKRLDVAVPNGVYQTTCLNDLFGYACGLSRAANTISAAATSATTAARTTFSHAISAKPAGWGTLGRITMTSGANAGISRTCDHIVASAAALAFRCGQR